MRKHLLTVAGIICGFAFFFGLAWYGNDQRSTLEARLLELQFELAKTQASAQINVEYTSIVKALIASRDDVRKVNPSANVLNEQEIIDVALAIHEQVIVHRDIGLNASIVLAVMSRETNFDPTAQSEANAYGLMQVTRFTAQPYLKELNQQWQDDILFDAVLCTRIGIDYLTDLHSIYMDEGLETKDDWKLTLHSYFWGPTNTSLLLSAKGSRPQVPSLEYSVGIIELQRGFQQDGLF